LSSLGRCISRDPVRGWRVAWMGEAGRGEPLGRSTSRPERPGAVDPQAEVARQPRARVRRPAAAGPASQALVGSRRRSRGSPPHRWNSENRARGWPESSATDSGGVRAAGVCPQIPPLHRPLTWPAGTNSTAQWLRWSTPSARGHSGD
jgi:hypothetical protein